MPDIPKKKIVAPTVAVFEAMAATEAATVVKSTPASIGKTKVSAAVADLMARATADTNMKTTIRPNQTLRPPEIKKNTLAEVLVALEAAAAKTAAIVNTTIAADAVKQKTVASAMAVLETTKTAMVAGVAMSATTTAETVQVAETSVEAGNAMEAGTAVATIARSAAAESALAAAGIALVACTTAEVEGLAETSVLVTTTASAEPGMLSTVVANIKTKTTALATVQTTTVAVKEIKDKTVAKAVVALKTVVAKTSATVLYYLYMHHWSHLFLQNLPQYLP